MQGIKKEKEFSPALLCGIAGRGLKTIQQVGPAVRERRKKKGYRFGRG
jgi:hypothetical protein